MSLWGESRRGTSVLVAVIVVSMVGLVVHLSRYADLATERLGPSPTVAGPPPDAPGTASAPSAASAPSKVTANDLTLPPKCTRQDNPPTHAAFPADDHFSHDITDYGDGAELQRLYAVQSGQLVPLDGGGPVRDCDTRLWAVVSTTTPERVLASVDEFMVFDADLSAPSDADVFVGEVEAYDGTNAGSWRLAIAPNGTDPVDLVLDVAHEVGHLASLGAAEIEPDWDPRTCDTMWTGQGCLSDTSTLIRFLDDTWTADETDEWNAATDLVGDAAVDQALTTFYLDHTKDFLTEYAASDPIEDFADTFAYWCVFGPDNDLMGDYMRGDPSDGQQKVAWMEHSSGGFAQAHAAGCDQLRTLTR